MNRYLSILILLCLIGCSKKPAPPPHLPSVTVVKAIQKDVPLYYEYIGHMVAEVSVEIKPQVSGILTAKFIDEGQEVKEGELLFTIDDRPYIAALNKAEAALSQTIATLRYSEDRVKRYAKLVQDDYVAQLNFDQYLTNVMVDEASIKENLADIDTAKVNLSYCTITAPMSSITGELKVDVGNFVDPTANQTIILLNQITPIEALFYIPERDLPTIQRINKESPLKVLVYLYEDRDHPYEGVISLIDNQVEESTGTVLLKAKVPNVDKALWPGEFIVARVIFGEQKGAILVPNQAIQWGPNGPFVFVIKDDNTADMRPVTLGQREDEFIIVESGALAGETIVLEGQIDLTQGVKVDIKQDKS